MKPFKRLVLSAICALLTGSASLYAGNVSGRLDEYHLGHWAYTRHNAICQMIWPAIRDGQLKTFTSDNKSLTREEALRMLETKNISFISTDSDDPTKGYDTTYWSPLTENFHSFMVTEKEVKVKTDPKSRTLAFSKTEFFRLLDRNMQLYLQFYSTGKEILLSSIPSRSSELMRDINVLLHLEGIKPSSKLYRTDSLISLFSEREKNERGTTEYPAFISTDPDDPTSGRDTILRIPLIESIRDSSRYQCIYFAMKGDVSCLRLHGLSAGFMVTIGGAFGLNMFYGFLEYSGISSLSADQKAMIEDCLLGHIEGRMLPFGNGLDEYMEYFKLTEEAAGKKNR